MADKKISALTSLAQGDVAVTTDVLPIVDTSATETKKVTAAALVGAGLAAGVTSVDINSGSIDGTTIGANSAAAGTFTNLTASGTVSFSGATVSNGGSVTTVDINGGTIDGATIATSDITVGSGKTLNVSAGTLTLADNQISGDKVEGGTINAITINTLTSTAVNATTVDATNVEVTNVKAKDGTAAATIADSTGVVSITANPILSGGTANGVLYLNGSKVATSGSALTFDGTNFATTGSATASGGLRSLNANGVSDTDGTRTIVMSANYSASTPGFGTSTNHSVNFITNNTTKATLDASGNLGIGTTSPATKLTVDNGDVTVTGDGSSTFGQINLLRKQVLSASAGFGFIKFQGYSTGTTVQTGAQILGDAPANWTSTSTPGNLLFYTTPSGSTTPVNRLTIDSSGNLGLGVTPNSGWTDYTVFQNRESALLGYPGQAHYTQNAYYQSGTWKYISSSIYATRYTQSSGVHSWYVSTSAQTAGSDVAFSQAMTLDANANWNVDGGTGKGRVTIQNASANNDILSTTTGFGAYNPLRLVASELRFETGSSPSERMRLDSSGNLGIGTSSPGYKLDVQSSALTIIRMKGGGSANQGSSLLGTFAGSTNTMYGFGDRATFFGGTPDQAATIFTGGAVPLVFDIAAAEKMRLDTSGNLGIGTSSPASRLDVRNTGGTYDKGISIQTASGGNIGTIWTSLNDLNIGIAGAHKFTNFDGSATRMTLDSSGNLGIGTSSPSNRLTVSGANTASRGQLSVVGASADGRITLYSDSTFHAAFAAASTDSYIGTESNTPFRFITNGSERARITSGGYFKASNDGTYLDSAGSYHEFRGGLANGYTCIVSSTVASPASQYVFDIRFSAATPNDTNARFLNCEDATATRAYIRSNGGLSNYQSNNTDLSDARTKNSITPAASMWSKVAALEIVTYKYNDQTHDDVNVGVIAQQVEAVEPVWVDSDGWDKETPEGEEPLKTVYTKDITFAAIKALQEAMARIEQLEAKVAQLEAR